MIATTCSDVSVNESVVYVSFELGKTDWKLAVTSGFAVKPWLRTVTAGDLVAVTRVVRAARQRFGVSPTARVRQQPTWWTAVRDWADAPLPATVQGRIARAEARMAMVVEQIATIDTAQVATVQQAAPRSPLAQLVQLKGVATTSASVLLD